MVYWH